MLYKLLIVLPSIPSSSWCNRVYGCLCHIVLWGWCSVTVGQSVAGKGVGVVVDEYVGGLSFDVFENANRYPGPTGLLVYRMDTRYLELPWGE